MRSSVPLRFTVRALTLAWLAVLQLAFVPAAAAEEGLRTPLLAADVDAAAYGEWVGGVERPITPADDRDNDRRPEWITWTDQPARGHAGFTFGQSNSAGPRHLRVGFKRPVPVGSVIARGGGRVSVLKPEAAYPGNLADDAQWVPAERVANGAVGAAEVERDGYAIWTLPAVVSTRAIRFTRDADVTQKEYAGWVGGVYLLPARVANLAPQATPVVSRNTKAAPKLVNEDHDGWDQWGNIPVKEEGGPDRPGVISVADPEWAMLVWPRAVTLSGVAALFAGFESADAQAYVGSAEVHPREAPESAWQTVASFSGLTNRYPAPLGVDLLDFGKPVTTRAIRLRITKSQVKPGHPHVQGRTREGKRTWIGELVALSPVTAGAPLATTILPKDAGQEKPPIAVKFTLPEAGWVTLVIEDATGKRVRNLISDTFFEKGENVAWWDGSDDLGRDKDAPEHGLYLIPTQFVQPGKYRVRGLWRKQVDVRYEFGVYSAGRTPWETADRTGAWLSNHAAPSGALFVPDAADRDGKPRPAMLLGSYVSEGTAGLAWVDPRDGSKFRGQGWVGGNWTGAPHLARDAGEKRIAGTYAYVAAAWSVGDGKKKPVLGEIRVTALTAGEDKSVIKYNFTPTEGADGRVAWEDQIGGVAAHNGRIVVSLPAVNRVIVIDAAAGKVVREINDLVAPHGLAFDTEGALYALSGPQLLRYAAAAEPMSGAPATLVDRLDEPRGLTLDPAGNIYVSQRGASHNVKMFSADGTLRHTFGKPGVPQAGKYDQLRMNNPRGLAIDPQGRLWVAEEDKQPKRVSVWNPDGSLARAFYGPTEYGGGGSVDPQDKSRYYYDGMEFKLDWEKGTDQLVSVFYRRPGGHEEDEETAAPPASAPPAPGKRRELKLPFRAGVPQNALYAHGQRYWINAFNSSPTGGHGSVFLFADDDGIAVPCAGAGRANDWPLLKSPEFASCWPEGTESKSNPHSDKAAFFIWNDGNKDGYPQPAEVRLIKAQAGGVTVSADFSILVARLNGKAVRFEPTWISPQSGPSYDISKPQTLVEAAGSPPSSGGDQALLGPDGWSIHTNAPKPFSPFGIGGAKNGEPQWSYPSLWPGLHASHVAPVPDRPGVVVGHTRLLGDVFTPGEQGGEPMFMLNSNHGCIYVFTADGLYITHLLQEMRVGRPWGMPAAQRGMLVNDLTPSDENFWPNVTRTRDGKVYLVAGRPNCILSVEGLETVKRLSASEIEIKTEDLDRAAEYFARAEAARQAAQGRGALTVQVRKSAPTVDGKLDDWTSAEWAEIDKRGSAAYFNSRNKPYDVTGAVSFAGDRLFAAWRTGDKDLLRNGGDVPNAPFKTGGCLDLMIAADSSADPKRTKPVAGDQRLLITRIGGKTRALRYEAVDASPQKAPVPFSSPWRTINFDRVEDVSDQVQLASDDAGNYEVSVPLSALKLKPAAGQTLRGDLGILRGDGTTTTQRVYWSNKATAIVADVPSEAELRPALWGRWEVKAE